MKRCQFYQSLFLTRAVALCALPLRGTHTMHTGSLSPQIVRSCSAQREHKKSFRKSTYHQLPPLGFKWTDSRYERPSVRAASFKQHNYVNNLDQFVVFFQKIVKKRAQLYEFKL